MNKLWFFACFVGLIMTLVVGTDAMACSLNFFFKIDIPQDWSEGQCVHGLDKYSNAPLLGNQYLPTDESLRYQWAYVHIIEKEVDLKEYIQRHVDEFEDTSLYENLCYYKEERFHGYKALSYTFGGQSKNVKCVGKIYAFHAHGYTFLFVNKFLPNKSGKRNEIDVWKTLKWYPTDNWKIQKAVS